MDITCVFSPRSACRLKEMWSRAAWWETSSTFTNRRGQGGCGRYRKLETNAWLVLTHTLGDNASQMSQTPNNVMNHPLSLFIRVSLWQLSGQPSWSGSSYRSMTSPRSIWSCRVTWGTPCTHTSCEFAEWPTRPCLLSRVMLSMTGHCLLEKDLFLIHKCGSGPEKMKIQKQMFGMPITQEVMVGNS